jgi:hypothetical protein
VRFAERGGCWFRLLTQSGEGRRKGDGGRDSKGDCFHAFGSGVRVTLPSTQRVVKSAAMQNTIPAKKSDGSSTSIHLTP